MDSPLDDLPEMDFVEAGYYNDFQILGSERNSGMSIGSIPVTRIIQYAQLEGIHNIEMFKIVMLRLDNYYLKLVSEEQKRKTKSKD